MAAWEAAQTNFLHLDAIEVEIFPARNDPENPWNLALPASPGEESAAVRKTLAKFLPLIFRRPLTGPEFERYTDLYQRQRDGGNDFKSSLTGRPGSGLKVNS